MCMRRCVKEVLIKSGMQITQTDFSSDCTKVTQEYLMYFKEFSCNLTENMQVRCVPRFIQRFLKTHYCINSILFSLNSSLPLNISADQPV